MEIRMKTGMKRILLATGILVAMCSSVQAKKFSDTRGTRYEGSVERLEALEIVDGVTDKLFYPDRPVTRAEFAKMLMEAMVTEEEYQILTMDQAKVSYSDVLPAAWYYDYVVAATNYGLISGFQDGTFRPNEEVTYEQMAKMMLLSLGYDDIQSLPGAQWADNYVNKMYDLQIPKGATSFQVKDDATRGNVAIMLWNLLMKHTRVKIMQSDKEGFVYQDSGKSLYQKKFEEDYDYLEDVTIKGFKEIDDKLCVNIGNTYYELEDQDTTIHLSMIGGEGTALVNHLEEKDVLIGFSVDTDLELKEGLLSQLKEEGFTYASRNVTALQGGSDYAYLLHKEGSMQATRVLTFSSKGDSILVEKVEIKDNKQKDTDKKKEDGSGDSKKKEDSSGDSKEEEETVLIKTILVNEDLEIKDGSVLFFNNQRVDWKEVQEGDVITTIKENEYYLLARTSLETTLQEVTKTSSKDYAIVTPRGTFPARTNAVWVPYASGKQQLLNKVKETDLEKGVGKSVKLVLDAFGNVIQVCLTESLEEKQTMEEVGLAYYYETQSSDKKDSRTLVLIINGKKQNYQTSVSNFKGEMGDLVQFEAKGDEITSISKISTTKQLNDTYEIVKTDLDKLSQEIQLGLITDNTPIYQAMYEYDFGHFDKVTDVAVTKLKLEDLQSLPEEHIERYVLQNVNGKVEMVLIQNNTKQRDIYYGKIIDFSVSEKEVPQVLVSVVGAGRKTLSLKGVSIGDEGDFVSFRVINDTTIQLLEKYSPTSFGYYKDLFVTEVQKEGDVVTDKGTFQFTDYETEWNDREYVWAEYDFFYMRADQTEDGWEIGQVTHLDRAKLGIKEGDYIAIDEIEHTVIIYRGFPKMDLAKNEISEK